MSECVVRMEMPQKCINCDLRYECNAFYAPGKPKPFMKGCMIVCQLPEGHGRLIDADKLKAKKYHSDITNENAVAVAEIDWAETIVPAERSEKDGR